ncbi:MAG TPA: sulfite exporter TauE/SafE family protein [Chloroflexaceae bacterium]|nr:sulfite exporter TauE/SafE family protein [Chloroflexaceae bacterium]
MLAALLLGLLGSLGHCVGMCGPIVLLLGRGRPLGARQLALAHLGRVTSYALLGAGAGLLGLAARAPHAAHGAGAHGQADPAGLSVAQGGLALLVAAAALYQALALLGRAPSPELLLAGLTRRWGRAMRGAGGATDRGPLRLYAAGLLWGLLPCGLVLTALLAAVVAGSPLGGTAAMLAFGLGTLPAHAGMGWLARRLGPGPLGWPRHLAALVVLLFGVQMGGRGLAAWGLVGHLYLGSVMLW